MGKDQVDNECAVGVYSIDKCVRPDEVDTIYIANGCTATRVLVELGGSYQAQVFDCFGSVVEENLVVPSGITAIPVPVGGLAVLKKEL